MESYSVTLALGSAVWWWSAIVGGLVVGSFLNVVIARLPIMMEHAWHDACADLHDTGAPSRPRYDLAWPRSHCPACQHTLAWHELIPILSWLRLRGRCAHCGSAIARRYPLVELSTALLFTACLWRLGPGIPALAAMGLCATLLALAMIDADTMLLPDNLTLPLLWAGLLLSLTPWGFTGPTAAIGGAALGYGLLWLVATGFKLVTRRDGMGHGDLKLLAALGAWFGWNALPAIILIASLAGVLIGVVLLLTGKSRRGQPMPFGPYLAAAGWAVLLLPQAAGLALV